MAETEAQAEAVEAKASTSAVFFLNQVATLSSGRFNNQTVKISVFVMINFQSVYLMARSEEVKNAQMYRFCGYVGLR